MPNINAVEAYQELLSTALEDRSGSYQDLVSNSNVVYYEMKERGGWQTFSGVNIRETLLFDETGSYVRYAGFDTFNPAPVNQFNDAVFEPKMAAVSITLSNEQILRNDGPAQILNILQAKMDAAEMELIDRFTEDLHSAGAETNQVGGFQLMIPTTPTNTYGAIDRNTYPIWRTTTYNANSITVAGSAYTSVISTSVKPIYNSVTIKQSRGKKGPNLILASEQHYLAYSAATETIQRITDETKSSKLGFTSLRFFGGGRSMDIVLEGGIGTAMPSDVSYFVDMSSIKFRYHPKRPVGAKIGGLRTPVNQDAVVQHMGFMGELTMNNPIHNAKLYDSSV